MKRLAFLLLPALCWAATTSVTVDQLIGMARAVPGEFSAEALVRIAAIDKVEKSRKIELLEEAFRRAAEAKLKYRQRSAIVKISGPSTIYNRTGAQGLDSLTLRVKAVNAMLAIDPAKAREMFLKIPAIKLPRVTCEDFLVYDVDSFFETLGRVARETFAPAEIEKGDSYRFLLPYISSVATPAELPGAARTIANSNVGDKDFVALMAAFGKAMAKVTGDDRSFTFAQVGPAIRAVVQAAARRNVPAPPLLEAYRLYLVTNMSGARCADDDLVYGGGQSFAFADPRGLEEQGPDPAAYFNDHLRMPPLQEIQETEITPSKLDGVATGLRGCDDLACKAIVEQYSALIFDSARNPYPTSYKETPEWTAKFKKLLDTVAAWQAAGSSSMAEQFREKCAIYNDLASIPPNPAGREIVLRAELEFLKKSKGQAENAVQWFLPINALIGRVTLDPLGLGKLTDDLRDSGDPIIRLFVELDALSPRRPDQIMPLI